MVKTWPDNQSSCWWPPATGDKLLSLWITWQPRCIWPNDNSSTWDFPKVRGCPLYHLDSRWRNSQVLVYHSPFTTVNYSLPYDVAIIWPALWKASPVGICLSLHSFSGHFENACRLEKKSHPVDTPLKTNISPFKRYFWVDDIPFPQVGYGLVPWRVAALGKASWSQSQPFFGCQMFGSPHHFFSYGRLMDRESFLFHRFKQKWRALYIIQNFRHSSIQDWCFQFQGLHFQSVPSSIRLPIFRWLRLCYFLLGSLFEEA